MSVSSAAQAASNPAQWAKAALRRLAMARLEPTPENYARAYAEESGEPAAAAMPQRLNEMLDRLATRLADEAAPRGAWAQALAAQRWDEAQRLSQRLLDGAETSSQAWAQQLERLARLLPGGGRHWTAARKKESLQRVLDGSRSDQQRLLQRLRQLLAQWEQDSDPDAPALDDAAVDAVAAADAAPQTMPRLAPGGAGASTEPADAAQDWPRVHRALHEALQSALHPPAASGRESDARDERALALADELAALAARIAAEGATAELAEAVAGACERAARWLGHRHELLQQLGQLCRELTEGLAELAEDDSWVRGQCEGLRDQLSQEYSVRGVRAAGELLAHTRSRQHALREERGRAREALVALIQRMVGELGELDRSTGRFGDTLQRYAERIGEADTLDGLAGVVRELVDESRSMHNLVAEARERLVDGRDRAVELEDRVRSLEAELRRISDEAMTDALTQVANRRGLTLRFEEEARRASAQAQGLSIGLIDIDNFKKLNDSLGHAAGDEALKALAAHVRDALRTTDAIARFGGEEFVVLMPATAVADAQQLLSRLQRGLTEALFLHESREVFVTFSAGVTAWRPGEALEAALARADEGLYEAKRTGKNRTCIA